MSEVSVSEFKRIDPRTGEVTGIERKKRGSYLKRNPSWEKISHLDHDWFPIRVTSGKEHLAELFLQNAGVKTFLPVERRWRHYNRIDQAKRHKTLREYSWRPGLIFVGLDWPYPWHILAEMRFFRHIISITQSEPRRMDQIAIWKLMKTYGRGRFIPPAEQRFMRTGGEFAAGDGVRVAEGPLEGVELRVEEITGKTARVFGKFFGQNRGFEVPIEILSKAT